ncbi:MAG: NAD(P)-dependent oxidoreductase [Lachnospiraceae bacterium]|nr:NAD(P)-dependent oxidoreductase [Lachnospiraceae bacterium]
MLTEMQLDNMLCEPSEELIQDLEKLDGDIMILGAGGKVGPTVSVMAQRASDRCQTKKKIYAVARFSDPFVVDLLKRENVTMITADLTDPKQIAELPKVKNIIYLVGRKFGTSSSACDTWEMNVAVPNMIIQHFGAARYVVFSTGNVYPYSRLEDGGCTEDVTPEPVGEYGMSSLGRERIFEYAAKHCSAEVLIYRLNYAIDLRYGVLFDIAKTILAGEPVSLNVPAFNCVSQRYVSEVAIRALKLASSQVEYLNVTGPETVSTKYAALELGRHMGKEVTFIGTPAEKALLSNSQKCVELFGYPDKGVAEMIRLQAQWLLANGRQLGKTTHFEEQKGRF